MDIAVAQQFLREHDNTVLATWRRDGRLQMSPVTVGLDAAGRAILSRNETAYKVRNLRRDPRATGCIFTEAFLGPWAQIEGTAEVVTLPEAMEPLVDYGLSAAGGNPDRRRGIPLLRAIILSGAPMTRSDVDLYQRHFSAPCVLLHMIGTSETMWMRRFFIDQATHIAGSTVPIGYALQDVEVTVLDESGCAVASGQDGAIAIQGRYLARDTGGSLNSPRRSLCRVHMGADQRIYFSGDLGRMEPDGCLFHLGRKDFQVKVRGFRVELSEVETALLKHPAVDEVAAAGRKTPSGDTQLVAYCVPTAGYAPTVTELGGFLREKLPDYMVPSAFVMLRALPYTPNGKLDYGALPAPESVRPELGVAYVAPKSEIEQRIATVWQEVLGVEKVGLHDNFFDLGGHSLLLAEVQSTLQDIFQQDIPIVDLFKHPTIHALVEYVSHQESAPAALQQSAALVEKLRAGKNRLKQLSQRRQRTGEHQ
jgi:PPOX class probable F420-dependent enzyme